MQGAADPIAKDNASQAKLYEERAVLDKATCG